MDLRKLLRVAEEMLAQRNVESVLFQGKKMLVQTNGEKLEWLAGELITEHEKRKKGTLSKVLLEQVMTPRILSTMTSTTTTTTTTSTSPSH